jgi:hypothetical protein
MCLELSAEVVSPLHRPAVADDLLDGVEPLGSRCEQWVGFERTQQSAFRLVGALDHLARELLVAIARGRSLGSRVETGIVASGI